MKFRGVLQRTLKTNEFDQFKQRLNEFYFKELFNILQHKKLSSTNKYLYN